MFISKRKNKVYYLFYTGSDGKNKMRSCKTKIKSEALKFLTTFRESSKIQKEVIFANYKISDLQTELIGFAKTNYRYKTVKEYKSIFNNFINVIGDIRLKLITVQQIEAYKTFKSNEVTGETVNKHLRTLKAGFNFAIKLNWIEKNPFDKVVKIKIPQKEPQIFTDENLSDLFKVIDDIRILNIAKFGLNSGFRLNEILNLQWNDIDFSNETITIRNKATFRTKSGKIRVVPLTNKLKEILLIVQGNKSESNIIEIKPIQDSYIFKKPNGYRFSPDFISHRFKKYCRVAGLPERLHYHSLRHQYITDLIKRGLSINFVKELAGHSDIKTTLGYTHITTEDLRQAINKITINL
jgi:site-specific recombinase XerD